MNGRAIIEARARVRELDNRLTLAVARARIQAVPGLDTDEARLAYAVQLCRDAGLTA